MLDGTIGIIVYQISLLFAVPSLLLALGKLNARDVLLRYRVPVSESPETDKHVAEIGIAYEKAMPE